MLNDLAALFSEHAAGFAAAAFALGLVIGSFLNVVIYRLPIMLEREWRAQAVELLPAGAANAPAMTEHPVPEAFSLVAPRSSCPSCKTPIAAWHNIPVVSWLMLRGRCAGCKSPIPARYPLVEIGTALLSAAVAWHFGFTVNAACALVVTWALVALTGIDVDHQLLPDDITLPLMWAGLAAAVVVGATEGVSVPVSPRDAILGAAFGYLSLWSVFHLFRLATGKEGMGYGDFKLYAALGAWLGWAKLPVVILLSAGTGAVLGILMIVFRGRDRAAPMPFGPYLAAAGWLTMMYGDGLVGGYLRMSGLAHVSP
jgi:leader peptidase (prepilin peptidase)/N-methyltransferase